MSGYRLHMDIPLPFTEAEAMERAQEIVRMLSDKEKMREMGVHSINYRLGHDEDRQKSNYFIKNANGHVNNKKSKVLFSEDLTGVE